MPIVAGIEVDRQQVLELASMLARNGSDHTSRVLLGAITTGQDVALTTDDRRCILTVTDDPPPGLERLRATLLEERERQQAGRY
jgi:hypothetical protein